MTARHTSGMGILAVLAVSLAACPSTHGLPDAPELDVPALPDAPDAPICTAEVCDGTDGDCDGRVDEEVSCTLASATGACVAGRCRVIACDGGHADCNGEAADGCEADLTDRRSCGACGVVCGIAERCDASACVRERILRVDPELRNTVALLESGRVLAWGTDVPLPDGRRVTSYEPFEIDVRAVDVTTTGRTILAVTPSHRLVGWGSNYAAELGLGYLSGLDEVLPLTEVPTLALITAVDGGPSNWIGALGMDGDVRYWGGERVADHLRPAESVRPNAIGLLSYLTYALPVRGVIIAADSMAIPTQLGAEFWGAFRNGLVTLMDQEFDPGVGTHRIGEDSNGPLDCSAVHCCHGGIHGGIVCWGRIEHGALGRDVSPGAPNVHGELAHAWPVLGFTTLEPDAEFVMDVATADLPATCAIRDDGSLWCWGAAAGAGLGTSEDQYFPVRVEVEGAPTALHAAHNLCVVLDEVHLRCWGDDRFGAVGRGVAGPELLTPTAPVGLE